MASTERDAEQALRRLLREAPVSEEDQALFLRFAEENVRLDVPQRPSGLDQGQALQARKDELVEQLRDVIGIVKRVAVLQATYEALHPNTKRYPPTSTDRRKLEVIEKVIEPAIRESSQELHQAWKEHHLAIKELALLTADDPDPDD